MPVAFDIEAELSRMLHPSTGDGARLVPIDDHAFRGIFAPDESTQRFVARSDGYLHDEPAVMAHVLALTPERRNEIVAGLALMRVLQFSEAGA